MNTVEKVAEVIEIQDQIIVKEFGIQELTAANIAVMEKQILEIPEKPETKKQYDSAYRYNVDAKKFLPRIEERRKELKAPILEKGKAIDETAKKAVAMVQPLIELSGSRRKAWEDEKAIEKARKERIEKERLEAIEAKFDMLNHLATKPMEYNRPAADIEKDIAHLEAFEISAIDFQERQGDAELIKSNAIVTAKTALENRRKFEAEQAEAARVREEQETERRRLEEERVKFEAERKAQEEAARKTAAAEAEKRRQEEEAIQAEREKLEAEKAAAAKATIITEREAVWDVTHQENLDRAHAAAIIEHKQYKADLHAEMNQARADAKARWEQTETARKAKAERLKLVAPDKLLMQTIADEFDKWVSSRVNPSFETQGATSAYCDLITRIKSAIYCFEQDGKALA